MRPFPPAQKIKDCGVIEAIAKGLKEYSRGYSVGRLWYRSCFNFIGNNHLFTNAHTFCEWRLLTEQENTGAGQLESLRIDEMGRRATRVSGDVCGVPNVLLFHHVIIAFVDSLHSTLQILCGVIMLVCGRLIPA